MATVSGKHKAEGLMVAIRQHLAEPPRASWRDVQGTHTDNNQTATNNTKGIIIIILKKTKQADKAKKGEP